MAAAIPPKVSRIVDIFVSIAAAAVILGALFKLEHWKGADTMLIMAMGTETLVFTVYGLLYLRYPAIDDHQVKLAGAEIRYYSCQSYPLKLRFSKVGNYS